MAPMVLSPFVKGPDNKTAFERQTGISCHQEKVPVGECVLYKSAKNSDDRKRVVGESWKEGIWLGDSRGSSDYLVGTTEEVVRAWSI